MNFRNAFTLVEVAVSGSLIGLCVLSALSIIPQGLRVQNEARMRAAAAATVMRLSAEAGTGLAGYTVMAMLTPKATSDYEIIAWDSNGAVTESAPANVYVMSSTPALGDLSRRIIFTIEPGSVANVITAWLLSKDPDDNSDKRAKYLATFTERI